MSLAIEVQQTCILNKVRGISNQEARRAVGVVEPTTALGDIVFSHPLILLAVGQLARLTTTVVNFSEGQPGYTLDITGSDVWHDGEPSCFDGCCNSPKRGTRWTE